MAVIIDGTVGITTPNVASTTSTLGALTQALNLGTTGQIVFPAAQNTSSDANTLDDYEEGTWTPTDGSGAGLSFTNTSGNCIYTKVGRVVNASFRVTFPSTASGSVAVISGLPFAVTFTSVNVMGAFLVENSYVAGATAIINVNTTNALILSTSGGAVAVATNANLSGKDLRGIFIYQTA